ncbi:sulfotransferase domain-containing protein [Candidatus Nitrospira salsa]|nr:MAG: sulfotransferase family protein [Nitrospirales bacterium]
MDNIDPTKVLYIAGAGRSGSTLLGTILGSIHQFCDIGEVHYLLDRGIQLNQLCACQVPLQNCDFWSHVIGNHPTTFDEQTISHLLDLRNSVSRFRHIPLHALNCSMKFQQRTKTYGEFLGQLYSIIRKSTGATVIIDSSKRVHGHVLAQIPNVKLYTLHLVRDSRASAYSWTRQKAYEPTAKQLSYMPTISTHSSSVHWMLDNLSAELLKSKTAHYFFLRYEDFVMNPQYEIKRILTFIEEEPDQLPFVSERDVRLAITHSVSGNPSRFHDGDVHIKEDEVWKIKLSQKDRAIVTFLTWPLLKRYGYI